MRHISERNVRRVISYREVHFTDFQKMALWFSSGAREKQTLGIISKTARRGDHHHHLSLEVTL